jgi:hypothetical protein
VQIRYLYPVLPTVDDWALVARIVKTLLKPGGTLQWIESDVVRDLIPLRASDSPRGTSNAAIWEGIELVLDARRRRLENAEVLRTIPMTFVERDLKLILEDCGFRRIARDVVSTDRLPQYRNATLLNFINIFETVARSYTLNKVDGWPPLEYTQRLVEAMRREAKNGLYLVWHMYAYTASV